MRPVLDIIERVGPSDANVLITGEHGTGKDVVARALHAASRARGQAVRPRQRRRLSRGRLRERALRPRARRLHRREGRSRRALRARRRRHALPRRDRQHAASASRRKLLRVLETGEFERGRLVAHAASDVRADLRDQRRSRRRGGRGSLPPGPALPPQHRRDPRSRRCASGARTSRCLAAALPRGHDAPLSQDASTGSTTDGARRAARAIRGRATCASSST